jgi:hypothetical protein
MAHVGLAITAGRGRTVSVAVSGIAGWVVVFDVIGPGASLSAGLRTASTHTDPGKGEDREGKACDQLAHGLSPRVC